MGAWQDGAETVPKSAEFCASHLAIMNRWGVNRRIRYEAKIRHDRAMNPNSYVEMSNDRITSNGHPYAPFDCVSVVNRQDPYDPKRNALIRFSMSLTVNVDARVQRHSALESESKIRTRDMYGKWFLARLLDPGERDTTDYGLYTWLKGMDPSYRGSLHTLERGASKAVSQQMPAVPIVPDQNGVLAPPAHPGDGRDDGSDKVVASSGMRRKAGVADEESFVKTEEQNLVGNDVVESEANGFGAQVVDSEKSLEPTPKRQKIEASFADGTGSSAGVKPVELASTDHDLE
jgi:hypothetical protein